MAPRQTSRVVQTHWPIIGRTARPPFRFDPIAPRLNLMRLHIINTETAILLSKQAGLSWQELQAVNPDYNTSLGPWSQDEIVEYLNDEYKGLEPEASVQVAMLVQSPSLTRELTFSG